MSESKGGVVPQKDGEVGIRRRFFYPIMKDDKGLEAWGRLRMHPNSLTRASGSLVDGWQHDAHDTLFGSASDYTTPPDINMDLGKTMSTCQHWASRSHDHFPISRSTL